MIGIIAPPAEEAAVREFFELFKTPWEFSRQGRAYDVVLATCDPEGDVETKLLMVYGSAEQSGDRQDDSGLLETASASTLVYADTVFPVYGNVRTFRSQARALVRTADTGAAVAMLRHTAPHQVIRVGFDLFREVAYLLRHGQPVQYAQIPTLDIHIALLRDLIVGAGLPLVEIPCHPATVDFTVCLTHDVDFLRLRQHKFDRTMGGFVYRATVRAMRNFLKGKLSLRKLGKNLGAVCLLPGVYLGVVRDFFLQFDRYLAIERDVTSTFFVLPFKHRPGLDQAGQVRSARAVRYDVDDIKPEIATLLAAGREIALHGIEAWRDPTLGREELARITNATGQTSIGTRSHWLYQCDQSPQHLEQAGFVYDSSVGYNETIGYRSGTTQVYRLPGVRRLLELPLHIMDTALFYPDHLDLTEQQAEVLIDTMIARAHQYGGVLTINWHHRSLGPERLWDTCYTRMLARLRSRKVWFATARQATAWFEARRAVVFDDIQRRDNTLQIKLSCAVDAQPQLLLRVHLPRSHGKETGGPGVEEQRYTVDLPFSGNLNASLPIGRVLG